MAGQDRGAHAEEGSTGGPVQELSHGLRDVAELGTRPLGPAGPPSAGLPDISILPTHRLTLSAPLGMPPAGTEPVPERAPRHRRLPGAEDYKREAEQLQARAEHLEQRMWLLSRHVEHAQARYQQLRGMATPTAAEAHERQHLGHAIARLVRAIDLARGEYVTLMSQAQRHREAAAAVATLP